MALSANNLTIPAPVLGTPTASENNPISDYGVKYRLEFSDIEYGKKFKLEILKLNYSGSVIGLTGGASPVLIEWLRNDDIEVPIMGSVAYLNFWEETGQDLSEFYTPDEKEFLVYIYEPDGMGSSLFWKGWLVQDEYEEEVNTNPFAVSVKAADMIASLGTTPIFTDSSLNLDKMVSPWEIIEPYIDESGLEFDFVDMSDFKRDDVANYTTSSVFTQFDTLSQGLLSNKSDSKKWVTYKEAMESVMRSFNCKLFQSRQKLYAANVMSLSFPSTITPNKIHTYDYSAGTWSHGTFNRTAIDIPSDIQPIDNSMRKRHTALNTAFERSYSITPRNLLYNGGFEVGSGAAGWTKLLSATIVNDNFKSGSQSLYFPAVTTVSDSTFNAASETDKNNTYRILEASTNPGSVSSHNIQFYEKVGVIDDGSQLQLKFQFSYFINETDRSTFDIRYSIEKEDTGTYFDVGDAGEDGVAFPTSGFQYKEINTTKVGEWVTETVFLDVSLTNTLTTPTNQEAFIVRIHSPNGPSSTVDIYFDDFILEADVKKPNQLDTSYGADTKYYNIKVSKPTNNVSNVKEDELLFGLTDTNTSNLTGVQDELAGKMTGIYVKATTGSNEAVKVDYFPKESDPGYAARYLEEWCLEQLLAYYGSPIKRYSGSFSMIGNLLTPLDVLDVDYSSYTETQLQGLTYLRLDLKQNRADLETFSLTQLPNAAALTTSFEKEFSDSKGF